MAVAETAELVTRLSLKDGLSRGILSAQGKLRGFDRATSHTQAALGTFGSNLARAGTIAAGALAAAGVASVKFAGDFEAQLNTINTIARRSPEELDRIGDAIRSVARATGTPLGELTKGYYDLLSAGIQAGDATNVLTAANRLAIGGLATTAETVDLLTSSINTYGGDATKAASHADVFAKAVERGKVTAAEIAGSFAQVGSVAASSGIEIEEIAAGYARLTSAGVPAAEAATQMRSALIGLTRRTGDLEKLEEATGKSYLSIAGKKGLVFALEELRKDAKKAGIPLIDLLGRVEGLNFTLLTTGGNFAAYNADLLAMGDAGGTAAGQMAERQKGLNFQLARLKALAIDAGITLGSALLPKITELAGKLNTFLTQNQGKIAAFATELATGFTKFVDALGRVDWGPLIEGAKTAAALGKAAVDAFLKLPAGVQTALVTGLLVNKATGGLITGVARDVAGAAVGGIIKAATANVQAVNVTVLGKNVIGGGGGPGGGPIGTVAKGGGLLAAAGGVAGIGSLLTIAAPLALLAVAGAAARQNLTPAERAQQQLRFSTADQRSRNPNANLTGVALTPATIQQIRSPLTAIALAQQRQGERTGGLTDAIRAQTTAAYAAIEAARLRPPPVVRITNTPPAIYFNVSTRDIQVAQQSKNRYGRAIQ